MDRLDEMDGQLISDELRDRHSRAVFEFLLNKRVEMKKIKNIYETGDYDLDTQQQDGSRKVQTDYSRVRLDVTGLTPVDDQQDYRLRQNTHAGKVIQQGIPGNVGCYIKLDDDSTVIILDKETDSQDVARELNLELHPKYGREKFIG